MVAFGQFLEVFISGLLAGVLNNSNPSRTDVTTYQLVMVAVVATAGLAVWMLHPAAAHAERRA